MSVARTREEIEVDSERHPITEKWHPDKKTVEEFSSFLAAGLYLFMRSVNYRERKGIPEKMYPEEWMELYAEWLKLQKPDNEYWRKSGVRVKNSPGS